jgi:demethylmenaquinone methyltransferase/2-methoxy-6-polyprenyl-1,4-benzoquinol methylase
LRRTERHEPEHRAEELRTGTYGTEQRSIMLSAGTYKWFYDKIACRYYNFAMKYCFLPFGGERQCRAELLASVDFSSNERILDMCCGTGCATRAIARKAAANTEIIGIDLSSGQIRVAERTVTAPNIRFAECNANSTDFQDGHFDKVFIAHALHEMSRENRLEVLAEARRVLKERGEVVVMELDRPGNLFVRLFAGLYFFYWLPFNFESGTRRDMLKHGLENEVIETGFKNVRRSSKFRGIFQVVQGEK